MASSSAEPGDAPTSVELVRNLLAAQFPQWSGLPIEPVVSSGTDHVIYRLGSDLVVRLPRRGWARHQGTVEAGWLPTLAPYLPLAIPAPLALGAPGSGYPFPWSVHAWLHGRSADTVSVDLGRAAVDLAGFAKALRSVPTDGAPARLPGRRGCPLAEIDDTVRAAVHQLGDRIDGDAAVRSWSESLAAPEWSQPEVWVHGDLLQGNLLVRDGRIFAVIDFGGLNVGDPSCDLQPAWALLDSESRSSFRALLADDDETWIRGRGWALCQAVSAMAGGWPDPSIAERADRTLHAVLADTAHR